MTRGLGGSLLPYRVRDFHSLFLASFPGAQPDPRFIHHRNGISEFQTSPRMSKLVADMPPNRVRYPTDHHFASGCSPPRLMATQLPSATWLWFTMARTSTVLIKRLPRRTHSCESRNPEVCSQTEIRIPAFARMPKIFQRSYCICRKM